MCDNHLLFKQGIEPSDEEIEAYEDCLRTPRSG